MGEMEGPPAKKPRLSLACNECRRRKVKCDTDLPQCRNCRTRNIECITSDPKQPDVAVVREWIDPLAPNTPVESYPQQSPYATNPEMFEMVGTSAPMDKISPAHQPYEMFFSRDFATNRMKMMGASSSACLAKSLDLYLRRAGIEPLSDHFRYGMRHAEELPFTPNLTLPSLPDLDTRNRYVGAYFQRVHRLWPLYDVDAMRNAVHQSAEMHKQPLPQEMLPILASVYLILSMGADECAQEPTGEGLTYLKAAASLIPHVIFLPYLPSVQALLCYAMACRSRNKDGVAWQMVGMAIRIAQSIGLDRHSVIKPSRDHGVTVKYEQLFHSRIWAICCCLEKLLQLESGRPSSIGGVDYDQMMGQEQHAPGFDYLQWNMGIAGIQEQISLHIYKFRPGDRSPKEILEDTARLDKLLLDWAAGLPREFYPANDFFCEESDFHIAAYLSVQYHQAMISLHRAGLVAQRAMFEAEVDKHCTDERSRFRLKAAESICIKSARAIARITTELADHETTSRVLSAGPPLLACIVIAIYLTKMPRSSVEAADLALLAACAKLVKHQYSESGQDERFAELPVTIHKVTKRYLETLRKASRNSGQKNTTSQLTYPESISTNTTHVNDSTKLTTRRGIEKSMSDQDLFYPNSTLDQASSVENNRPRDNVGDDTVRGNMPSAGQVAALSSASTGQLALTNHPEAEVHIGPLPFDDYNVEDLWNWMLLVDNNQSPVENPANNRHVAYI